MQCHPFHWKAFFWVRQLPATAENIFPVATNCFRSRNGRAMYKVSCFFLSRDVYTKRAISNPIHPSSLDVLVGVQDAGERQHGPLGKCPRGLQNLPARLERDHDARVDRNLCAPAHRHSQNVRCSRAPTWRVEDTFYTRHTPARIVRMNVRGARLCAHLNRALADLALAYEHFSHRMLGSY